MVTGTLEEGGGCLIGRTAMKKPALVSTSGFD
jgi:hypothetical protein